LVNCGDKAYLQSVEGQSAIISLTVAVWHFGTLLIAAAKFDKLVRSGNVIKRYNGIAGTIVEEE
jgi:hypothetical protein